MVALELEHLTKIFIEKKGRDETVAVDDFSLVVEGGEFLVLVGPSGCGKTTLLRLIAGLETPDRGSIYFDSECVNTTPTNRRNLGMVFQSFALYPTMTVFENMSFNLRVRRLKKPVIQEKVYDAARFLGIEYLLNRKPKELSIGQRQRVALGRALVGNPGILLFDEPLSNVDEQQRAVLRGEIRRIRERTGATVVFVTHDLVEAMSLADRIAMMSDGKLLGVGTPAEMMDSSDPVIHDFMSEVRHDKAWETA